MSKAPAPMDTLGRKIAFLTLGLSQADIARQCDVDMSLVCHIMAGRRWRGPAGRRVMTAIAEALNLPITVVFPGSDRRKAGKDPSSPVAA